MVLISILFFSKNVFYPIKTEINIWGTLILLSAIAFKLVKSKIPSFGKGLIDGKSSTTKSTCESW